MERARKTYTPEVKRAVVEEIGSGCLIESSPLRMNGRNFSSSGRIGSQGGNFRATEENQAKQGYAHRFYVRRVKVSVSSG